MDTRQYAVLRMAFGLLSIWYFIERLPFAWLFLSSESSVNEEALFVGLLLTAIVAALGWTLGVWARLTGVLTWLSFVVIENQNPLLGFPGSELLKLVALPLLFAPTGRQWSGDCEFLKRAKVFKSSPLPLFLIRVQVVFIFMLAGYSKLQSQYWAEGDALVYMLLNPTISRLSPVFVADFSWFFFPLSSVVSRFWILFEIVFPILILFPVLRRTILNVATALLLLSLLLFQFGWLPLGLLALLFAFFTPSELDVLEARANRVTKRLRSFMARSPWRA